MVYFGKLEFLDIKAAFAEVFGDKPTILPPNPVMLQDTTTAAKSLYYFFNKWKLYVFMHMCRRYHVWHDLVHNSLIIQDVCRQISEIKQECKVINGDLMRDIPNNIFDKFL